MAFLLFVKHGEHLLVALLIFTLKIPNGLLHLRCQRRVTCCLHSEGSVAHHRVDAIASLILLRCRYHRLRVSIGEIEVI